MRERRAGDGGLPRDPYEAARCRPTPIARGRYRLRIGGRLTLHGVTRPHRGRRGIAGLRRCASGSAARTPLRLSDYRIRPVTALGGTIRLKDELRLTFDLVAPPGGAMSRTAHPGRLRRQHLPGRRCLRRRGRPAAAAARAAGRGPRRRFRHPRPRPGLRPARRLRGGHPRGRGPARRAARHALRPRAGAGRSPEAGRGRPLIESTRHGPGEGAAAGRGDGRARSTACCWWAASPPPADDPDEMQMGLSEPVRAAVEEAVALVVSLAERLLDGQCIEATEDDRTPEKGVGTCPDC